MKETQIKHTTNNSQGTKNVDNTHASELTFDKQITTAICPAKTKKDRGPQNPDQALLTRITNY